MVKVAVEYDDDESPEGSPHAHASVDQVLVTEVAPTAGPRAAPHPPIHWMNSQRAPACRQTLLNHIHQTLHSYASRWEVCSGWPRDLTPHLLGTAMGTAIPEIAMISAPLHRAAGSPLRRSLLPTKS